MVDTWDETVTDMPTARRGLSVISISTDIVYAIGGMNETSSSIFATNEEYDPSSDTWTSKSDMPTPRGRFAVGVSSSDKIYAVGGENSNSSSLTTNEEYDPSSDTWTSKTAMATGRSLLTCGITPSDGSPADKLYAVGGYAGGSYLSTNEEYDISTDTWTSKTSIPTARAGHSGEIINSDLYVATGESSSSYLDSTEEYNTGTDSWTSRDTLYDARTRAGSAVITTNSFFVMGGDSGTETNEEFDNGTWRRRAVLPTPRYEHGCAAYHSEDKIFVIGGYDSTNILSTNNLYNDVAPEDPSGLTATLN